MTEYLTVLTTTDTQEKANTLARSVVEAKLAACAQIDGPITSIYRWEGAVQTEEEWRVLFKTTTRQYPALETHIITEHDYDAPEIIATPITHGSTAYLTWLATQTTKD